MTQDLVREAEGYNSGSFGLPEDTAPHGILCGNHPRFEVRVRHENPAAVRACYEVSEELASQQADEIYAEGVMSWVAGGGSPEDAGRYAAVVASGGTWDGGIGAMEFSGKLCEHQMALELCAGPQHYPMDI
jgi:hypothetical protein